MHATKKFSILGFGAAVLLSAVLFQHFRVRLIYAWAIAVSLITFLVFGYDKAVAGTGRTRVPEKVLLALVFVGGTIGAIVIVAMPLFHHKTSKASFRYRFWGIVVLQMLVVGSYLFWYR